MAEADDASQARRTADPRIEEERERREQKRKKKQGEER